MNQLVFMQSQYDFMLASPLITFFMNVPKSSTRYFCTRNIEKNIDIVHESHAARFDSCRTNLRCKTGTVPFPLPACSFQGLTEGTSTQHGSRKDR